MLGEEFVRVDRDVAGGFGGSVLQEIAGHPVAFAGGGKGFDGFAEVAGTRLRVPVPS